MACVRLAFSFVDGVEELEMFENIDSVLIVVSVVLEIVWCIFGMFLLMLSVSVAEK